MKLCKHCEEPIKQFLFGFGLEWAHYNVNAVSMQTEKDKSWRYCKLTTAEPEEN